MSRLAPSYIPAAPTAHGVGELVFSRSVPPGASLFDCLRMAWEEAQRDACAAYAAWRDEGNSDGYSVYRAAQDRADTAQDVLARWAPAPRSGSTPVADSTRSPAS